MTDARPRRHGFVVAASLLLGIAVAGVVVGPRVAPSLMARDGALAKARRKFEALRSFALFRARGDRAVLRGGEPPSAKHRAPKH
jgi:hypothetical protein